MPDEPPLEGQVQCYWRLGRDLRLARAAGADDHAEVEELADLANFTNYGKLRRACLSQVHCDVVVAGKRRV